MINAWWYTGDGNNFGDIVCPVILEKITNQKIILSIEENSLCSIGSIAFINYPNKMVFWGSGAIDELQQSAHIQKHRFCAVRGPKTRKRILQQGGHCPEIYGDPGLLLPIIFPKEEMNVDIKYEYGILPHWVDLEKVKNYPSLRNKRIKIIDIRDEHMNVIKNVLSCKKIITSSLHGLIVGESYKIPTAFLEFDKKLYGRLFKFEDYFHSTGRELHYLEHHNETDFSFEKAEKLLQSRKEINLDLKKFISSFPYEIKNKNLIEFISK